MGERLKILPVTCQLKNLGDIFWLHYINLLVNRIQELSEKLMSIFLFKIHKKTTHFCLINNNVQTLFFKGIVERSGLVSLEFITPLNKLIYLKPTGHLDSSVNFNPSLKCFI